MKLVRVHGKPFMVTCKTCGIKKMSDDKLFYADTEGEPFKDYYCVRCAPTDKLPIFQNG